ncbi:hypothetical protein OGATHE_006609 [Ogataea polymorpha]|uniref:Uncharacterized protein n=1 Tax=Ogataea polymorpha TaxID=460523 RepID=A0A9P8NPM6_9ASCO|nr:hypothetical protein OGATHE_006609 [Ogataea polymorpha]
MICLMLCEAARSNEPMLTWMADLVDDLADLGLESHVQHSVGLVQHEIGHTLQVGPARVQHVQETTRSGNTDFCASGKVSDLLALRDSTVDTGVSDSGATSELRTLLLNLHSKFSCWSQDQTNWAIAGLQKGLGINVHNCRQAVRQGLSRSC